MNKSGIYTITNIVNGKMYVGKAQNLRTRKNEHFHYLRKRTHWNNHLQNAWNKYGEESFVFEILELWENEFCHSQEHYWCNILRTWDMNYGYNLALTNPISFKLSVESKNKMSNSRKGIIFTQEHRNNLRIANMGRVPPNKGKKMSEEQKILLSKIHKGKKRSPESIEKGRLNRIGEKHYFYGQKHPDEVLKKMSQAKKGKPTYRSKPIINTETGEIFDIMLTAAQSVGIPTETLRSYFNGRAKNKTKLIYLQQ